MTCSAPDTATHHALSCRKYKARWRALVWQAKNGLLLYDTSGGTHIGRHRRHHHQLSMSSGNIVKPRRPGLVGQSNHGLLLPTRTQPPPLSPQPNRSASSLQHLSSDITAGVWKLSAKRNEGRSCLPVKTTRHTNSRLKPLRLA